MIKITVFLRRSLYTDRSLSVIRRIHVNRSRSLWIHKRLVIHTRSKLYLHALEWHTFSIYYMRWSVDTVFPKLLKDILNLIWLSMIFVRCVFAPLNLRTLWCYINKYLHLQNVFQGLIDPNQQPVATSITDVRKWWYGQTMRFCSVR